MGEPSSIGPNRQTKWGATALGLITVTIVVQFAGIARTVFLGRNLGAGSDLDAFYVANAYTVTAFNVVSAAITTSLIPGLVRHNSLSLFSAFLRALRWVSALTAVLIISFLYFAPHNLLGLSSHSQQRLVTVLALILMVGQQLRISSAVNTAAQQVSGDFLPARLLSIAPAAIPLAVFLLTSNLLVFVIATAFSYALEALGNSLYNKWRAYGQNDNSSAPDPNMASIRATRTAIPIIVSSALFQVQMMAITSLIGYFGIGLITVYSNASQVVGMLQALIVQNVITLAYPALARWTAGPSGVLTRKVGALVQLVSCAMSMVVILLISTGKPVTIYLFARGNFTVDQANRVYAFLVALSLSVPLATVRDILYRILYARDNALSAAKNSIWSMVLAAASMAMLVPILGVWGIFGGIFISQGGSLIGAWIRLRHTRSAVPYSVLGLTFVHLMAPVFLTMGMPTLTCDSWRSHVVVAICATGLFLAATFRANVRAIQCLRA